MIVSESYQFSGLGQEKPAMNPDAPYRVSATLVAGDRAAKGIEVLLLDASGETILQKKVTDVTGNVFFDVPSENPVIMRPTPPKGYTVSPEEAKKTPLYVDRYWLSPYSEWEWSDSVLFTIGLPGAKAVPGKSLTEYLTLENVLIGAAVLVGGYLLFQWFGGDE